MHDSIFQSNLLEHSHVLVTGGGTGLGRSFALRCAALGAKVTVMGRRPDPLSEVVATIQGYDSDAFAAPCNIRNPEEVEKALDEAETALGPVTHLINCAAANFLSETHLLSPNGFDAIIKTNLYGSFYLTRLCGERWINSGHPGSVVTITTTYAGTGSAFVVPSAMSKAGLEAMTRSLAVEWGVYGIRLNAVQPGPFPTKGAWNRLVPNEAVEEQMKQRVPLGRFGEHPELENLVVFLLGPAATFITGSVITIDGGEVLQSGGQFNEWVRMDRDMLRQMMSALRG